MLYMYGIKLAEIELQASRPYEDFSTKRAGVWARLVQTQVPHHHRKPHNSSNKILWSNCVQNSKSTHVTLLCCSGCMSQACFLLHIVLLQPIRYVTIRKTCITYWGGNCSVVECWPHDWKVSAGVAGLFSSPGPTFCTYSHFGILSTPTLLQ